MKSGWREHPSVPTGAELSRSDRAADAITHFAGSMPFVYLHILLFGSWLLFFEKSPWQVLTMVVSLEAIFLSTFVMISQNRADHIRAALALDDYRVGMEDHAMDEQALELIKRLCAERGIDTT